ncbi:MAG: sortase [Clostridia bacterium]|nr:sortase [Clostridia bacterium]
MNQILVTEKLYVTPELKKRKKMYKVQFFLSVFLVFALFSYYIYAEYDRDRSEEVSQEILESIRNGASVQEQNKTQVNSNLVDSTIKLPDNVIIVALEEDVPEEQLQVAETNVEEQQNDNSSVGETRSYETSSGITYDVEGTIRLDRLGIDYPVLSDTSEELLKISINKYWGPAPNQVGNYCVVGHNYKNKKMFGRLSEAVNGDIVEVEDLNGHVVEYSVYDKYVVEPDDTSCTSQLTNGRREVTLITCTNYGTQRLVVKAREV